MSTTRQLVVGYGCEPYLGQTIDLCERHATTDGPGAEERLAAGVGHPAQVDERAAVCKHRSQATADGHGAYCLFCGETLA